MKKTIRILVVVTFLAMVVINALASILPINGMDTGQVSDSYPNLFAPTGLTFAIWGVIYILLAMYSIYQLGFINKNNQLKEELLDKVGLIFSISSIANAIWIFTWHYQIIYLSMILMVTILVCLIMIVGLLEKEQMSVKEKIFVKLPFSVYFGWITVATIANATTLLVSLGWNRFGLSEVFWMIGILIIGTIIGVWTIIAKKDFPYGLVFAWAFLGILIKHISGDGFNGRYLEIVITVIVMLTCIVLADVFALSKKQY